MNGTSGPPHVDLGDRRPLTQFMRSFMLSTDPKVDSQQKLIFNLIENNLKLDFICVAYVLIILSPGLK